MWITIIVSEHSDVSITNGDKGQVGMVIQSKYENIKKKNWLENFMQIIDISFSDIKQKE